MLEEDSFYPFELMFFLTTNREPAVYYNPEKLCIGRNLALSPTLRQCLHLSRPRLILIAQPPLEPRPNRRPLRVQNRVPRGVTVLALDHHVLAKHPFKAEPQALGGVLGTGVAVVAFPLQASLTEVERFFGQQVNRFGAFR